MASRRPSGDTATDIDVPSLTGTSTVAAVDAVPGVKTGRAAGARPCDATSATVLNRLAETSRSAG